MISNKFSFENLLVVIVQWLVWLSVKELMRVQFPLATPNNNKWAYSQVDNDSKL